MKAYVDLGANTGDVAAQFAIDHPDYGIFCVEPNPELIGHIHANAVRVGRTFVTMWAAAWISDGKLPLFLSEAHDASTVVPGKVEHPQIDYTNGINVPCFDFSRWMLRTFRPTDDVIVKMDIEGAEYAILEKMLADGSLSLIKELRCEWHHDRFPAIGVESHNDIRARTEAAATLVDWH
jgi:FkbM family methyltransferase